MNQTSPAVPPPYAPEPWRFTATQSQFSSQFLLQQYSWLREWLITHSSALSAGLGLLGIVLVTLTWISFQHQLARAQEHMSAVVPVSAAEAVPGTVVYSAGSHPATGSTKVRAHIAGAVRKPGVYELENTSVVQDLVAVAGGLSGLVWQDYLDANINLAAPLLPNQKIWIPSLSQQELLVAPTIPLSSVGLESAPQSAPSETAALSINTASVTELDTLAGIGTKRAEAIVAGRPYTAIDELTSKAGVPVSIVNQLRTLLTL